jgi:hypothetical protein
MKSASQIRNEDTTKTSLLAQKSKLRALLEIASTLNLEM